MLYSCFFLEKKPLFFFGIRWAKEGGGVKTASYIWVIEKYPLKLTIFVRQKPPGPIDGRMTPMKERKRVSFSSCSGPLIQRWQLPPVSYILHGNRYPSKQCQPIIILSKKLKS